MNIIVVVDCRMELILISQGRNFGILVNLPLDSYLIISLSTSSEI